MIGIDMIYAERKRQIEEEGFDQNHDQQHSIDDLYWAACCYAGAGGPDAKKPATWPFTPYWWKPSNRIRNLEKAGALFLAAADRAHYAGRYHDAAHYRKLAYSTGHEIDLELSKGE